MDLNRRQTQLCIRALSGHAKQLEDYLKTINASDRDWDRVSELYALALDLEFSIIGDTNV